MMKSHEKSWNLKMHFGKVMENRGVSFSGSLLLVIKQKYGQKAGFSAFRSHEKFKLVMEKSWKSH